MSNNRYKILDNNHPYFVTLSVNHWLPVFNKPPLASILLDTITYLQQKTLVIHEWVMLEDHLHLVAKSCQLEKDLTRLKSFVAKQCLLHLQDNHYHYWLSQFKQKHNRSNYEFWHAGLHSKQIFDESMMRQKIEYIHQNPVKRGYVDKDIHWRYSSARDYNGEEGLLTISKTW